MVSVVAAVVVGVVMSTPVQALNLTSNTLQLYLLNLAKVGRPQPRIIGGERVTDRCRAPFSSMVALQLASNDVVNKLTHCSAVMISPDLLLTAAVCMTPYFTFPVSELSILLGEKNFDFQDRFQTTAALDSFKVHPDFNSVTDDNNIALIKLRSPATLNQCVQPLQRYQRDVTTCASALMNCTVTGWGVSDLYGNLQQNSKLPMYGHIRLVDEGLSAMLAGSARYPDVTFRQNSLLGLPFPDWNVQACFLDWGGMAACQVGGNWKLRGVIGEHNCGPQGTVGPMILTNVENFGSWIDACLYDFHSPACRAMPAVPEVPY